MKLFQSTHPRGVRLVRKAITDVTRKFQSTHPRGVRPGHGVCLSTPAGSFNPRTRVGCDTSGAGRWSSPRGFNPRTRVGCDTLIAPYTAPGATFQSTHPRGVRRHQQALADAQIGFQSTHPRGVRQLRRQNDGRHEPVSIHAPAWGATAGSAKQWRCRLPVSIHAPAWGAT